MRPAGRRRGAGFRQRGFSIQAENHQQGLLPRGLDAAGLSWATPESATALMKHENAQARTCHMGELLSKLRFGRTSVTAGASEWPGSERPDQCEAQDLSELRRWRSRLDFQEMPSSVSRAVRASPRREPNVAATALGS